MLDALRVRDFRYLWGGRFVSSLGSWLLVVAIPAFVFQLTGSVLATGLTMVAEYLPALLLGPVAGVLTDRWDRRRVLVCSDVFRAAAVAGLVLGLAGGSLWVVWAALAAESAGTVLFRPAAQALTPEILGRGPLLSSATSLNAFTDGTVRLVAPPVGAALLAVTDVRVLIAVDVASYLISAIAVWRVRPRPRTRDRSGTVSGVVAELAEGVAFLRDQQVARVLLVLTTVFLLANASLSAVLIPFGVLSLGGAGQIGLVVSGLGVGFLLGALVIRLLVDRVQPRYLLAATQLATAGAFLALFTSTSPAVALPAAVAIGTFGSMTLVTPQTALQRVVPDAVLGRVGAVFFAAEALATLVGALAGPALAQGLSITTTAVIACAVTAGGALVGAVLLPVSPTLLPRQIA